MEQVYLVLTTGVVLLGAIVGSFLNVVILRLPAGESIVFPGSHCPKCDYALSWYDNVPILSWLILRGRCRKCKAPISIQYPIVEGANALLYFLVVRAFDFTPATAIYCVLSSALLVLTVIDLRFYLLPDEITVPGLGVGLLVAGVHSFVAIPGLRVLGFVDAVLGVLLGGGVLLAVGYLGSFYLEWRIKKFGKGAEPLPEHARLEDDDEEELAVMAMGGGDIKLLAMLGAFLGWRGAYVTLMVGCIAGAVAGLATILVSRRGIAGQRIPFGPYLALGAILTLLYQDSLIIYMQQFSVAFGRLLGIPAPPA